MNAAPGYSLQQGLTGTLNNTIRYTGRDLDRTTNLYYYRARYYDPAIGRFISEDPIGFAGGINLYAYVNNNPINANDPSGNVPLPLVTGAIGAAAGATGNAIGQIVANNDFDNLSLTNVGVAAGVGFVAGAVAPYTAVTYLGAAATAGLANIAQYTITQTANSQPITTTGLAVNGISGLVAGAVTGPIAQSALPFSQTSSCLSPGLSQSLNNFENASLNTTKVSLTRAIAGSIVSNFDYTTIGIGASGGFLLYPNKSNANALITVYSK